ncbi:unnamed protein product [Leptosia nina]|uniref:Coatomer subunit delta n=1 Tax=Leptosia nina TaxID=320188 RepID=A0AAV1JJ30_9NEOP
MVLIAATVCTKSGKALVSRQFVEMTKARIEGLLAAFPKLMTGGRQHTFVETESVRYVYQPLDKLYMLLITTKASNILEDLETLRLFSRVVPEYCTQLTEAEVLNQAFNLLFAFDEIVALGYRESVNLAQVRSFVEMDSHEEKIYQAVRQTQEREAANRMREKAKQLQRERLESAKGRYIGVPHKSFGTGFGSSTMTSVSSGEPMIEKIPTTPVKEARTTRSAMKLGSRGTDADSFVSRLQTEGEKIVNTPTAVAKVEKIPAVDQKDVHLRFEERLNLTAGRDGDIQNFELSGLLTLRITNEQYGRIHVHVNNKDTRPLQLQTHPNVDKEAFRSEGIIRLKQAQRPFPMNSDVGVLKWRLAAANDDRPPLSVNCWPSEGTGGGCDVNIEYELEQDHLVLADVNINIPMPSGNTSLVVHQWEGSYTQKGRTLVWNIPLINKQQKSGTLEFTVTPAIPNDFFPLTVTWTSDTSLALISSGKVVQADDVFPPLKNYEVNATLVSEVKYPWIARVIHSRSLNKPHVCTAICVKEEIFITAARCITTLHVTYTTIIYKNHNLYTKAFILPSNGTKQAYDDIGFIVVHKRYYEGVWDTIQLYNKNRTDNVYKWFRNNRFIDTYKVVGYSLNKGSHIIRSTYSDFPLTELEVFIDIHLCNEVFTFNNLMGDFNVPCYHSCTLDDYRHDENRCSSYHGVEGGAVVNTEKNYLLGVATWGAFYSKYELPVGLSVINSRNFYEDYACARKIQEDEMIKEDNPDFYQELCNK